MPKTFKPTIAITLGDPAGIGPEIILKALKKLGTDTNFLVVGSQGSFKSGRPSAATAAAAVKWLKEAVRLAKAGKIQAIVTGPISKHTAHLAGFKFPGQTEFLAHSFKTKNYAMLFYSSKIKVILVTIHLPLKEVSKNISEQKIINCIKLGYDFLKKTGIKKPRIGVAGLNPHAGEAGDLGTEDEKIIQPAVKKAKKAGFMVKGPVPPDIIFKQALEKKFDLVVAMYHDQGLIPLKMMAFDEAVNVTLGLPIARTSPDHGTAFDIAGLGQASPKSMMAAIKLAVKLAQK